MLTCSKEFVLYHSTTGGTNMSYEALLKIKKIPPAAVTILDSAHGLPKVDVVSNTDDYGAVIKSICCIGCCVEGDLYEVIREDATQYFFVKAIGLVKCASA